MLFGVGFGFVVDQVEIGFLQFFGDWVMVVGVDFVIVYFVDWCDFCGSVSEEGFVGDVYFVVGDVFFDQFKIVFGGQGQDSVMSDVVQVGGDFWGVDYVIFDDEDVFVGVFGYVVFWIEYYGFVGVVGDCFLEGQY